MTLPPRRVPLQLALRILVPDIIESHVSKFWLGELPESLPIELPLPEQTQIIASLRKGRDRHTVLIRVFKKLLLTQSWYYNRLRILGWYHYEADQDLPSEHSFTNVVSRFNRGQGRLLTFCYQERSVVLILTFSESLELEDSTFVKAEFVVHKGFVLPCQASGEVKSFHLLPYPELIPLPDACIKARHSGGSEKDWQSEATLQTSTSGRDIFRHYNNQLAQIGWNELLSKETEPLLWSIWSLVDHQNREWQLVFSLALHQEQSDLYSAHIWLTEIDYSENQDSITSDESVDTIGSIPEDIFWQLYSDNPSPRVEAEQLYVGEFPSKLSIGLSFPEEAHLVGSFIIPEYDQITLYFNITRPHHELQKELTNQLIELGWNEWEPLSNLLERGFETLQAERLIQTDFFHPASKIRSGITLFRVSSNCTDMRFGRTLSSKAEMAHVYENLEEKSPIQELVPILSCPEQTEVTQGRISGEPSGEITSIVHIKTSLSSTQLFNHYHDELQKTDWRLESIDQDECYYLSFWSYTNRHEQFWYTKLYLLGRASKRDQYVGFLKVSTINEGV